MSIVLSAHVSQALASALALFLQLELYIPNSKNTGILAKAGPEDEHVNADHYNRFNESEEPEDKEHGWNVQNKL